MDRSAYHRLQNLSRLKWEMMFVLGDSSKRIGEKSPPGPIMFCKKHLYRKVGKNPLIYSFGPSKPTHTEFTEPSLDTR